MVIKQASNDIIAIEFTKDEILMVNQAFNEICNGIHFEEQEFVLKTGFERDEMTRLHDKLNRILIEHGMHDVIATEDYSGRSINRDRGGLSNESYKD